MFTKLSVRIPTEVEAFGIREEPWPEESASGESGTLFDLCKRGKANPNFGLACFKGLEEKGQRGTRRKRAHETK